MTKCLQIISSERNYGISMERREYLKMVDYQTGLKGGNRENPEDYGNGSTNWVLGTLSFQSQIPRSDPVFFGLKELYDVTDFVVSEFPPTRPLFKPLDSSLAERLFTGSPVSRYW